MTDSGDVFKALNDPRVKAEIELASTSKEYMERTLMLLQIIKISTDLYGGEEASKLTKPYVAALTVMKNNMEEVVQKFNKEHGEV